MDTEQARDEAAAGPNAQANREASLRDQLCRQKREIEELAEQLVETQDLLLAMYDLSQATRSHLGLGETLRHLANEATRLVCVEGAILCVGPTIVHHPTALIDDLSLLNHLEIVEQRGTDLILNPLQATLPTGITNICFLPINLQGRLNATLVLINREGNFTAPDLKLGRAIAEQAGAHIEHALLYQETLAQTRLQAEMDVARRVQLHLLPQARPNVPTLDIYADSRPALQVGGDFYDFVSEPDRPLLLLLGDVAGKGISAAMIMGLVHTATRSAARFMPNPTPAKVLSRTNNDLYDDLTQLDSFITAFIAQYIPEQELMRYANAGHAPVIYRPPEGPARLVESDGIPLGVLPITLSEDHTFEFGAGALLVVTTDGFSEAHDANGVMFGYEQLLELVDEFADQPAQVIAYGLYNTIDSFTNGQPQEDDQTLIIIKGLGKGGAS